MLKRKLMIIISIVMVFSFLLAACSPGTEAEVPTEPDVDTAPVPEVEVPTTLKIGIGVSYLEEAWVTSLLQSLERVIAEKPHNLTITYDVVEDVQFADARRILDQMASTGEYDIIWAHSAFYESVGQLMNEYPEIAWAVAGAGNEAYGGNMWYMDMTGYESSYLIGVLAGLLNETGTIGTVAEYPFPLMNTLNNAYKAGAQSVNPDIRVQFTYIESWYDPPKAIESALAQIANGADFIFSQPIGPIEACIERDVWCAGNYVDQTDLGPSVVLTSNMIYWMPHWEVLIDAWWDYAANGVAYDAPTEVVIFGLADEGCDIFPINDMNGTIPADVIEAVMNVRQQIIDGEVVVEYNPELPE